jgi:hypothetical protein
MNDIVSFFEVDIQGITSTREAVTSRSSSKRLGAPSLEDYEVYLPVHFPIEPFENTRVELLEHDNGRSGGRDGEGDLKHRLNNRPRGDTATHKIHPQMRPVERCS